MGKNKEVQLRLTLSEIQHKELLKRMEKLGFKSVTDYIYALIQYDRISNSPDEVTTKNVLHICKDEFKRVRRYTT